jgi:hypothetical protein
LPWRYPGKFAAQYPDEVPHTNHSDIPHDELAPMAWQYPVYFNGNYGNCALAFAPTALHSRAHLVLAAEGGGCSLSRARFRA